MRRSSLLRAASALASSLAFCAILFGGAREARAGLSLSAELDGGMTFKGLPQQNRFGGGITGVLGYRFHIGPAFIAPEAGGGYMLFDAGSSYVRFHPARAFGGVRFGVGRTVTPQIYAHLGYGWLGGLSDLDLRGYTADAGIALDFKLISILALGLHGGYVVTRVEPGEGQAVSDTPQTMSWINAGAHVTLEF
ncbi:MAG: hypothetical protein U0359_06305 [Byssovorax sp.]